MKKILLLLTPIFISLIAYNQELSFKDPSPFITSKDRVDKPISVSFTLKKATKDCEVEFEIIEDEREAKKDKDYTITTTSPIALTSANKYSGKVDIVIKADVTHQQNNIVLNFKFKDENGNDKAKKYEIQISDFNAGSESEPHYTDKEKDIMRNISIEVFTGGTFDFFEKAKFQNIGGEFVVAVNNIIKDRFGGFIGISNFQNFSFNSSNRNVRTQNIRIDTGVYVNGVTKYVQRTFVDHQKISSSQWSYYVNPTFRLNDKKSDFVNVYLSLRLETLQTSTTTEFQTDTLNFSDTTNRPLGNSPVFQSGKGFLLQKANDIVSNGYFSIGFPLFLNAKDKFKLYFDPNLGVATYGYTTYKVSEDRKSLEATNHNLTQPFYLFRTRITEQFTGLNITVGGEVRGLFGYNRPTKNVYLGIRANISKWFSKDNSAVPNN